VSLDSGRVVEGSVDGGEKMSSGAGVLGGRESRTISAVGMSSSMSVGGGGGGIFRVMVSFARLVFGKGFFSDLSVTTERCFFGERTGSVLTGSRHCQQAVHRSIARNLLLPRTGLSGDCGRGGSLGFVLSDGADVFLRLNRKGSA